MSLDGVKNKIKIEILWNQLIGSKFKNQINIDIPKLKKIEQENLDINNFIEYDLSEIFFKHQTRKNTIKNYKKLSQVLKVKVLTYLQIDLVFQIHLNLEENWKKKSLNYLN